MQAIKYAGSVQGVAWTPDDRCFAVAALSDGAYVYERQDDDAASQPFRELWHVNGHDKAVLDVAFSPSG